MLDQITELINLFYLNEDNNIVLRERLLDNLLWASTELDDRGFKIKYLGQRFWSENAINSYINNNPEETRRRRNFFDLRHDHIIPRCKLKEMIENRNENENILNILQNYAYACIVTNDEHNRLNYDFNLNEYEVENWIAYNQEVTNNIIVYNAPGYDNYERNSNSNYIHQLYNLIKDGVADHFIVNRNIPITQYLIDFEQNIG